MAYTARFSETWYPLAVIHADSLSGEQNSGYVSLANYHRAVILIDVGDMVASATLDCQIEQATTTAGASPKDITGKAITQLTQAGGDSDQLICIEVTTEELDVDNGFDCINVEMTGAAAATEYSVWVLGDCSRYKPVPTTNWEEIVT